MPAERIVASCSKSTTADQKNHRRFRQSAVVARDSKRSEHSSGESMSVNARIRAITRQRAGSKVGALERAISTLGHGSDV